MMKKALDLVSTVLVTAAATLLLWTLVEDRWVRGGRHTATPRVEDVSGLSIEAAQVRRAKGAGPIALVEFTDYECSFCAAYTRNVAPQIDKQLIETGAIRDIVFNFPLEGIHPAARKASEAAECAARQQRYWEMHTLLFSELKSQGASSLPQLAKTVGLDSATFTRCLAGEARDAVAADLAEGRRLGVTRTPTFFVGIVQADGSIQLRKRLAGGGRFEDFQRAVGEVSAQRRRS